MPTPVSSSVASSRYGAFGRHQLGEWRLFDPRAMREALADMHSQARGGVIKPATDGGSTGVITLSGFGAHLPLCRSPARTPPRSRTPPPDPLPPPPSPLLPPTRPYTPRTRTRAPPQAAPLPRLAGELPNGSLQFRVDRHNGTRWRRLRWSMEAVLCHVSAMLLPGRDAPSARWRQKFEVRASHSSRR